MEYLKIYSEYLGLIVADISKRFADLFEFEVNKWMVITSDLKGTNKNFQKEHVDKQCNEQCKHI